MHAREFVGLGPRSGPSSGSRHQMPSSRPWRRSTSWQPGMQPRKSWATSNSAALQSVMRGIEREQFAPLRRLVVGGVNALQQLDRAPRPDAPVAEQPAADAQRDGLAIPLQRERREQVRHDVVVVAGVERDAVLGACLDHAAQHVERAVAVERRDLDRHHVVDLRETPPEARRQMQSADRGLQVEAKQRQLFRRPPCSARSVRPHPSRAARQGSTGPRDSRAAARSRLPNTPARSGRPAPRS